MAVDRTEDYRDAVKSLAVRLGYDQARLAQVSSAMMLKPTSGGGEASTKDAFARLASDVLSDERALHSVLMSEGREYCSAASDHVVGHAVMERRRDAFEAKVGGMVKECKEGIEALRRRLPPPGGAAGRNAQLTAHQHGVVLILTEHLQLLSSTFERLRSTRLQRMLADSQRQRQGGGPGGGQGTLGKQGRIHALKGVRENGRDGGEQGGGKGWQERGGEQQGRGGEHDRGREQGQERGREQMMQDAETVALQEELRGLLSSTAQTEARVMELAALNHLFAVHVLQQSEQVHQLYAEVRAFLRIGFIESSESAIIIARAVAERAGSAALLRVVHRQCKNLNHLFAVHVLQQSEQVQQLYAEAVAASERIDKGNKELKKAASHGSSQRTFLILFFFVLPLSLLFYDWYDRRQRFGFGLW
ncbi:unnamed protein product [Closterium sp. Naga37s-1]|nr:unnamed protein product [Closterium sp. Naga37s-1]